MSGYNDPLCVFVEELVSSDVSYTDGALIFPDKSLLRKFAPEERLGFLVHPLAGFLTRVVEAGRF